MFRFLKWVGIAAMVSLPVFLVVKAIKDEMDEDIFEDDFDIFGEEIEF